MDNLARKNVEVPHVEPPLRSGKVVLFSLLFGGLLLRLLTLGSPAITDPSEGRYAVMGQNMVLSGDWLTPRTYMDGQLVPFLGKPPLHSWATATSYSFFGVDEVAARIPSFLASAGTVILCAGLAAQCFGMQAAICTVLLLLSSWLFFFLGSSCLTDPLLMFFVTLSMTAFAKIFLVADMPKNGARRSREVLLFAALSFGMMVKGPIAIAIPGLAIGLWSLATKRIAELRGFSWSTAALIFFAIVAPWYVLAERANPGFLKYFFINENLLRFFVKNYGDRYGSGHVYRYGTIWLFLLAGFLPGALMFAFRPVREAAAGLIRSERRSQALYFLFWAASPAMIFTFSRQISPSYVLPGIPGLAVLAGAVLARAVESLQGDRLVRLTEKSSKVAAALFGALLIVGCVLAAGITAALLSLAATGAVVTASRSLRFRGGEARFHALSLVFSAVVLFFAAAAVNISPLLDSRSSAKEALAFAGTLTSKSERTVGFFGLLPYSAYFYSRQPQAGLSVTLVTEADLASTVVPVLVVHKKQAKDLVPKILLRFHEIAKVGDFTVYGANSTGPSAV